MTSLFTCSLLFAAWASPHASSPVSNALIPTTQEYGYIQKWSNMLISQWFSKTPKGSYFFLKLHFGPAHKYKLLYLKHALGMHQEYISPFVSLILQALIKNYSLTTLILN